MSASLSPLAQVRITQWSPNLRAPWGHVGHLLKHTLLMECVWGRARAFILRDSSGGLPLRSVPNLDHSGYLDPQASCDAALWFLSSQTTGTCRRVTPDFSLSMPSISMASSAPSHNYEIHVSPTLSLFSTWVPGGQADECLMGGVRAFLPPLPVCSCVRKSSWSKEEAAVSVITRNCI